MGLANIAATNMEHLCTCSKHGYSQSERWGSKTAGVCTVKCEGHESDFFAGDRDCSSAVIDAWQEALIDTPYEGKLAGATYTGNMRKVFVASGLFEWKPMSFIAQRGDIYLNEKNHTAMCTNPNPDTLAEFSISETGGVTGKRGDQTGGESRIRAYYDYPWDGILHYNGKADTGTSKPAEDYVEIHTTKSGWTKIPGRIDALRVSYAQCKVDSYPVVPAGGKASDGDDYAGVLGKAAKKVVIG